MLLPCLSSITHTMLWPCAIPNASHSLARLHRPSLPNGGLTPFFGPASWFCLVFDGGDADSSADDDDGGDHDGDAGVRERRIPSHSCSRKGNVPGKELGVLRMMRKVT